MDLIFFSYFKRRKKNHVKNILYNMLTNEHSRERRIKKKSHSELNALTHTIVDLMQTSCNFHESEININLFFFFGEREID